MHKKTLISYAIGAALGASALSAEALVLPGLTWTLGDWDGDGLTSDFFFGSAPSGSGVHKFAAVGETGCANAADGNNCDPISFGSFASTGTDTQGSQQFAVGEWTTGFNFGGSQGPFNPNIADNTGTGDLTVTIDTVLAAAGNGQALQFGALELGGVYSAGVTVPGLTAPGQNFYLAADHLSNCTGGTAGLLGAVCGASGTLDTNPILSNPLGYNVSVSDLGGGNYGVIVNFVGTIGSNASNPDPSGGFVGQAGNWRLEGVVSTVIPVPAAVWLFGSGLIGLVGVARRKRQS